MFWIATSALAESLEAGHPSHIGHVGQHRARLIELERHRLLLHRFQLVFLYGESRAAFRRAMTFIGQSATEFVSFRRSMLWLRHGVWRRDQKAAFDLSARFRKRRLVGRRIQFYLTDMYQNALFADLINGSSHPLHPVRLPWLKIHHGSPCKRPSLAMFDEHYYQMCLGSP